MNKADVVEKLDALNEEIKMLREVIERTADLEYDGHNMYVAIVNGNPYILIGYDTCRYFRWHSLSKNWLTEQAWSSNHKTGQAALDCMKEYGVHVFTDGKEGVKFFYEHYNGGY